jgi:hypothetical protein
MIVTGKGIRQCQFAIALIAPTSTGLLNDQEQNQEAVRRSCIKMR